MIVDFPADEYSSAALVGWKDSARLPASHLVRSRASRAQTRSDRPYPIPSRPPALLNPPALLHHRVVSIRILIQLSQKSNVQRSQTSKELRHPVVSGRNTCMWNAFRA